MKLLFDAIFVVLFVFSFVTLSEFLKDRDAPLTQPWECVNHGTQCEALQVERDV
jgi:hypothetical protein